MRLHDFPTADPNLALDHHIQLPPAGSAPSIDLVIEKARKLSSQLTEYVGFLADKKQNVEISVIRSNVKKELESLERVKKVLISNDPNKNEALQTLRSTNIGYHITVWETAKCCTGVLTFQKRVYWETSTRDIKKRDKPRRQGVTVDITAGDGAEWVKVSTVTEHRLGLELAEKGYGGSDDEDEDGEMDEDGMVEIVKAAHDLRKASQATRVRYKHPQVRFVLPKITPGCNPQVDKILNQIRGTGATVDCGSTFATQSLVPLGELFVTMLPMASYTLTPTVNVDCTILLALVSDLSHYDAKRILREAEAREPGGRLHEAVIQQLRKEDEEQLLPKLLYPLLKDHEMVCTEEAASRMREIVDIIATDSEKDRTAIFMGDVGQGDLHNKLSRTTIHDVPKTLNLPIKTVPANIDLTCLPAVSAEVDRYFDWNRASTVTKSVFLYGWQSGITTITSNRTVAKGVETVLHEEDTDDGGPDLYVVAKARSLVGKEKRGAMV